MVNTEKFSARLNKILNYYDISAAVFADRIDVGRSSISHILSGRNKPSLDFVMKVVKNFPEVELYWLLNGKGSFPSLVEAEEKLASPSDKPQENISPITKPTQVASVNSEARMDIPSGRPGKQIKKIVIFYDDGSFEAFEN